MEKYKISQPVGKTIWVNAVFGTLCVAAIMIFIVLLPNIAYADESLWTKVDATLRDIYDEIFKLTSIIAGVMAIIALIIYMVSNNPRTIDEAKSWLKRIIIAWLIINGIGYFVAYGKELFSDVQSGSDVFD